MNSSDPEVLTVAEEEGGVRLDVFLTARLGVSRERAKKLLEGAAINDAPAKASYKVEAGDEVTLDVERPTPNVERPTVQAEVTSTLPPIIYEDESLIILNKPCGLVVHEGAGEQGSTLVDILRAHGKQLSTVGPPERGGIVHRLDKDTTGVIAVCKTDEAHWQLAKDFAERRVRKEYSALVCSVPRSPGRIEAPIDRHPKNRKKMAVVATGRNAVTEYSVLQSWLRFALLNVNILTGRTHQIRVHMAYLNHPVIGDAVYGGEKRALENAPNEEVRTAMLALQGQALHAAHLSFAHPVTGEKLSFHAPLPSDMQRVIDALSNNDYEPRA